MKLNISLFVIKRSINELSDVKCDQMSVLCFHPKP